MGITCDYCGKAAHVKGMPQGAHWLKWMSDESRGYDAIVVMPNESGEIGAICFPCLKSVVDGWDESRPAMQQSTTDKEST